MAIAKVVCGDCGGVLSQEDRFCPQCGTRIEHTTSNEVHHVTAGPLRIACKVCGNQIAAAANFCESCGAMLKPDVQRTANAGESRSSRRPSHPQKKAKREAPRFESWQVVTGVVVFGLAAFFTYMELNRDRGIPPKAAREDLPIQSVPTLPEIERLQQTVDANPKDEASTLRLANMLHDAALRDSRLLMRAINTYSKYLELKPEDPNARVDRGICYFEMARVDTNNAASLLAKSIQEMESVVASNPAHQPAAFNLAIVNLNAGHIEESTKWFTKTVEINPNSELGKRAQQLLEQHSFQSSPNP